MRKLYWYLTIYFKKHGFILVASILSAIILFAVFLPLLSRKVTLRQRRYIGVIGEYTLNNLPDEVMTKISAGLTAISDDQKVEPALAERWSVEDEGKTYRFILKEDIKWQDDKPLEPSDIKYNFHDTEIITTPNDIVFKLPAPFSPFPSIVSKPIYRIEMEKYLVFLKRLMIIGIGENKVIDYTEVGGKLKEIVIDNPDERLVFRVYLTKDDAIVALKKGEIDYLSGLPSSSKFDDWKSLNIEKKLRTDLYLAVFFNHDNEIFSKSIRQALAYSIEKADDESRIFGPINRKSWAHLEGGKSYKKDLDRAVERLMTEIPNEPIKLELTTTSLYEGKANSIKQQWIKLGELAQEECNKSKDIKDKEQCVNLQISVDIKITNFPDVNNFQLLLMGQRIPSDPDQYSIWHSGNSGNFTKYQNTRIDSLLEKGRQTIEAKDRLAIYQEFQQFLLEDPPAIFLENLYTYDVYRE